MKPSVLELFSTPIVTFKIEEDTQELNKINTLAHYINISGHMWRVLPK